ncbi:MAG: ArsA family ATPase [Myxococcota bacterium]
MRLLLYTGKGGVGKTTTAAATAACAAARGERALVVSADAAHSLGDVLDERLGATPVAVAPGLEACEVDARHVIETHWGRVREYLVNLLRHQGIDEVVAEELALLPGADELATLVSVEDFAASGRYDLIVVDCAPTGSTLRLVTLPEVAHGGLRWLLRLQRAAAHVAEPIARGLVGMPLPKADVFEEAERLFFQTLGRLRDRLSSDETSVRLVVTPESMVIDEARRALTDLALFELGTDAVVLNRMLPPEALEEAFFREWGRAQEVRRAEVASVFAPLPILEAPLAEDEVRGVAALAAHGERLFGAHAPSARLGQGPGLRFERDGAGGRLRLPLSGRDAASLDVARIEDELVIGVAGRRRRITLPAGFARLEVERVAIEDAALVVAFGEPAAPGGVAS